MCVCNTHASVLYRIYPGSGERGIADPPQKGAMREVVLRIRHRGEPESDVSAAYPGVTLRSVSSMTGTQTQRKRIIEVSGDPADIADFLEEFRATDPIVEAEPLSALGGSRIYVSMVYDVRLWDSISARLSNMGVHYRMGTTITGGWEHWTLYLDDDEDVGEVMERLEAGGNDVRLAKNVELSEVTVEPQLDASKFLAELTTRQRDALVTAIDLGYYGTDRQTTVEEIAAEMGVAPTTAWEHLARAESKVMTELGGYLK